MKTVENIIKILSVSLIFLKVIKMCMKVSKSLSGIVKYD